MLSPRNRIHKMQLQDFFRMASAAKPKLISIDFNSWRTLEREKDEMKESFPFLLFSGSESFQSTAWELSIGHKYKKMAHPDWDASSLFSSVCEPISCSLDGAVEQ